MAQELYPYAEAASTQPKGVPTVRFAYEHYKELPSQRGRYFTGIRVVYGLTHKLTVGVSVTGSNHHRRKFPDGSTGLTNYFQNHHLKSYPQNPYQVEGFIALLKYRFLNIDGHQRHFRMAVMGSVAKSFIPHDSAEPRLGDNSGAEGSWIATLLLKRFAVSLTNGYIFPAKYKDKSQGIVFQSGNCQYLNVSLGYRLIPSKYSSYSNVNVNFYLEFITASYGGATMSINGQPYSFDSYQYYDKYIYNSLQPNTYSEMRPSLQFILYSTTRIETGVASPIYNQSYLHFYPMYFISIHRSFFKVKKNDPKKI
ncbi:MAG TPA: hypothetical protein VK750_03380 [Cytophagaceae bacterium]|nr:hypothetical protein [Cytophagaceae bacterium]